MMIFPEEIPYGCLANVNVRPIFTPLDSKNDLAFEVVFLKYTKEDEAMPFFMCKIQPEFLKKLGQHLINCVDKCDDIKSKKIFKESHYKEFGMKIIKEDIIKQTYMG